ncbi:sigma-54 interaction domain-containing protein [Geobacter grbiciae]|uniref:sigma-54 interaction domain-containing protein n=1 Tax=Geobacter grbiciae TaxID=155042 RepID=UPI001C029CD0|nr:sigma 54-interacting transcriptional regulator [Geobacter grbiciae]MBT1074169.1 sigma 54-interacting transcriptional regulator [Geobacter grbiciae]
MDTSTPASLFLKADYCRCGIVLLDESGRVTALNRQFFDTTGLEFREGDLPPDELRGLKKGEWIFWGRKWFVQAEGRQGVELLAIRRVRAADHILGPYGENCLNEEMVKMVLDNPYEGLTVVDATGKVTLLSPSNEQWLGLDVGGGLGLDLSAIAPASHLSEVARTGVAEHAQVVDLHGKTKVTVNLPIRRDNKVMGAFGRILFKSTEQVEKLVTKVRTMELQVERFETLLDEMRGKRYSFRSILTKNKEMLMLIEQARRVADSGATVLILGESGTGKELFAQALHEASRRNKGPFIAVNCGAIPRDLIESELFGYEEGAFSGARKKGKPGKFELACGGTLFLDEIGELPLESQAKLLRVLEERKIDRLGGTAPLPVDFRLVAATNRDLMTNVNKGRFRADLYYRINEFPLEIPPLRSRPEDIPLLAKHFLAEVSRREELPMLKISAGATEALMTHDWPGNVRELRGVMRQMAWKSQALTIEPHHLPPALNKGQTIGVAGTLEEQTARAERAAIESALQAADGNRALTARMLGIHRTALYKKMHRLGME